MSKSFLFKFLLALSAVTVAVLWLLSMFYDPIEGKFNIYWAVTIVSGVAGSLYIIRGLFSKNVGVIKKLNIFFGAGMLVICLLSLIQNFAELNKYFLPIVAIIGAAALLLCVLAVGGKAWDEGDNKKVGYKNYYQRKAEEEKQNKD